MIDLALLAAAVAGYAAAGGLALAAVASGKQPGRGMLGALCLALALHGAAIAARWADVGHGPYTTMFEILSSNVWSLAFVFAVACWRIEALRTGAVVVLPIIVMMSAWMLGCDRGPGHVPPTYDTIWLWVHMLFGKVFLGAVLAAVGLSGVVVLRRNKSFARRLAGAPQSAVLEDLAYRFLALAFVSETMMLIVGAIWAQDAWGRYWAWDSLETWAFLTWLSLAFALHARATLRPVLPAQAALAMVVFVLAFLTFFGVPFVSAVPHQGAI